MVVCILLTILLIFSINSTSSQPAEIFFPGIRVEFHCNVSNPFIQVNDIETTLERGGIHGYVEDLQYIGIEPKNIRIRDETIPMVCVNGSSPQIRDNYTIICQEVTNRRFTQTINHHTFVLTYQTSLPPPENFLMRDNMLTWNPPSCVSNSSSDTYRIEVTHTLQFTYTIYITNASNGTPVTNISSLTITNYNLSQIWDELQPCSEYHIEVCACNLVTEPCREINVRSKQIVYTMSGSGCSVQSSEPQDIETTTISSSIGDLEQEDSTQPTSSGLPTAIVIGVVIVVTGALLIISLVILYILIRKRNAKAVDSAINIDEFSSKDNQYEDPAPSHVQRPPTYEQSEFLLVTEQSMTGQTNGGGGLIYAELALTQSPARVSPPADDSTQTYVTVQPGTSHKPESD